MSEIKFNIKRHSERRMMLTALAESGYKVRVETHESPESVYAKDHFVVVEVPDEDIIRQEATNDSKRMGRGGG